MDLIEAEDIKTRWQEYTEELYKKIFMTQKMMLCLLTYSQTSWNVKSSGPQKASLGTKLVDGIPVELFQILKRDAVKMLHSICQQIWKTQQVATGLEKVSFHYNPKERQCQKCTNYHTIALISHARKVMLKILQAMLQQYMNQEFSDIQPGFRKGRGTREQISNIC